MKLLLMLTVISASLFFFSCENNTLDSVQTDSSTSKLVVDTLYASSTRTLATTFKPSTLSASRLQAGDFGGYTFRPILRFTNFPTDTLDASNKITVTDARIEFKALGATGNAMDGARLRAYRINQPWLTDVDSVGVDGTGKTIRWQDRHFAYVNQDTVLGEMEISINGDNTPESLQVFEFDEDALPIVTDWADTTAGISNFGLMLDPVGDLDFIMHIEARLFTVTDTAGPTLIYSYKFENDDSVRTDTILAISDAFLIAGDLDTIPGRTYATTYDSARVTLLQFDFEQLNRLYPNGFNVASANLQIPIDWANTIVDTITGPNLQLVAANSDSDSVSINLTYATNASLIVEMNQYSDGDIYLETQAGNERQDLAGGYVQVKLNDSDFYDYFYIEEKSKASYFSRYVFFQGDSLTLENRPRIIIKSLLLPDERL